MVYFGQFFYVAFSKYMVLKTIVLILRFQRKNQFARYNDFVWQVEYILAQLFGQDASFLKLIFALEPWNQAVNLKNAKNLFYQNTL